MNPLIILPFVLVMVLVGVGTYLFRDNGSAKTASRLDVLVGKRRSDSTPGLLKELDFDLALTGFDGGEIDTLLLGDEPDAAEDVVPELPENPVTRTGDLWLCGRHRVLCADSTDENAVSRLCGLTRPNLMATDPPYGVSYDPSWRVEHDGGGGTRSVKSPMTIRSTGRRRWSSSVALRVKSILPSSRDSSGASVANEPAAASGLSVSTLAATATR